MRRRLWIFGIIASGLTLAAHAAEAPPPGQSPAQSPAQPAAAAATPIDIGRSTVVVNDVDGQFGDTPAKHIQVNDDIVFQEDITTGEGAKAVIEFRDGSTFELGPDSAVRIDSFIFNPEESTSQKTLEVARGVFRYVSGFVASDQNTQVLTSAGSMAIRGSLAEGIVDPAVPNFVYLGEGAATFTNAAGSTALQPGNSIAVPSAQTQPMAADAMPAPVAAQALQAIETRLPPRADLANRSPADEAWLKQAGTADLVPVAQQRQAQAGAAARPLPAATGRSALAGELGLLTEANRLNLFNGRQTIRTPEQTAFLARTAREHPDAGVILRRFDAQSRALHNATMNRGTTFVLRGVGHAAPSADVMRRVTAAAVRANPGAAAAIRRGASEAYRGNDRGELNRGNRLEGHAAGVPNRNGRPEERAAGARPGNERPVGQRAAQRPGGQRLSPERAAAQRPAVHQPNAFERRQPGFNARPPAGPRPANAPRAQQQRPGGQRPQQGGPQRKKDERDQR